MRELHVVVVKTGETYCEGDRQFCGYIFEWPSGGPVSVGIDKFCQFGVRFIVGKSRSHLPRINLALLCVTVVDPNQNYPKGRFRRFKVRADGVLCLMDDTETQVQFGNNDDPRVLEWLGWTNQDLIIDIGVRYEEGNELREGMAGPRNGAVQCLPSRQIYPGLGQAV